jgi:hypothetical protein
MASLPRRPDTEQLYPYARRSIIAMGEKCTEQLLILPGLFSANAALLPYPRRQ